MDWALLLVFLISAFAAGEMARARQRSVYPWVGWATIIGPLALVLLLCRAKEARNPNFKLRHSLPIDSFSTTGPQPIHGL